VFTVAGIWAIPPGIFQTPGCYCKRRDRASGMSAVGGSDRADIAEALQRDVHAVGDMARLDAVHVERKHGAGAALLGPAHHPAEPALFGAEQPALGADDGIAGLGHRQDVGYLFLAASRDPQRAAP